MFMQDICFAAAITPAEHNIQSVQLQACSRPNSRNNRQSVAGVRSLHHPLLLSTPMPPSNSFDACKQQQNLPIAQAQVGV